MAIKGNRNIKGETTTPSYNLTPEEINFIIAKLRQADYKGSEFEIYFNIQQKLQKIIK